LLVTAGAELIIHLGDVETAAVIDQLAGLLSPTGQSIPAHLVFGNVDYDAHALERYADSLGISVANPVGRLDLDGNRELRFMHGHRQYAIQQALADRVAYLCHGHTHTKRDQRIGQTRVINPGALVRAKNHTVALLDTQTDNLTFHTLETT